MATNDGDVLVRRISTLDLGDESGGSDNIEGCDTKEALGIVDTLLLEDFGDNGDSRVDL